MDYQIVIYSADAVFSRMLELEFSMRGMAVLVLRQPNAEVFSEIAILDLDSASAPSPTSYRRMIGFTRGAALAEDEARRQCSMILHRPFEMRLLRREILGEQGSLPRGVAIPSPTSIALSVDSDRDVLHVSGKELSLTPTEACVMRALLRERGVPVSRDVLSGLIGESSANKLDVYICFLRRKLEKATGLRVIRTVRGKGYCIVDRTTQ